MTQGREHLLGEIVDGKIILNDAGQMILKWWNELSNKFPNVVFGTFIVMPNHFHGIIVTNKPVGADLDVCPNEGEHIDPPLHSLSSFLPPSHNQRLNPRCERFGRRIILHFKCLLPT